MVSDARFIVGGQTFAVRGITSVRGIETSPSYSGPITCMVVGGLLALAGTVALEIAVAVIGVSRLVAGIWWLRNLRPSFGLVLRTAGGELKAYESRSRGDVFAILEALNKSIAARR